EESATMSVANLMTPMAKPGMAFRSASYIINTGFRQILVRIRLPETPAAECSLVFPQRHQGKKEKQTIGFKPTVFVCALATIQKIEWNFRNRTPTIQANMSYY